MYVPGVVNSYAYICSGFSVPESNLPLSEVTMWFTESELVQSTEVPALIVKMLGVNDKSLIMTVGDCRIFCTSVLLSVGRTTVELPSVICGFCVHPKRTSAVKTINITPNVFVFMQSLML